MDPLLTLFDSSPEVTGLPLMHAGSNPRTRFSDVIDLGDLSTIYPFGYKFRHYRRTFNERGNILEEDSSISTFDGFGKLT